MKRFVSILLVACLMVSLLAVAGFAAGAYEGKTVILYSGNVRGDVDIYPQIAAAKKDFESKGAEVVLVDAGNYLQGTAAANTDRGLSVYNLMDAAGYDVAGMGLAEFSYTDATTGYIWHQNLTKYYTQAELQTGVEETTYPQDAKGEIMAERDAKEAALFQTVCANAKVNEETKAYSFKESQAVTTKDGLKVLFYGITDSEVPANLQDGYVDEVTAPKAVSKGDNDLLVCLAGTDLKGKEYGDIVISAPFGGEKVVGAYVIDNATKAVTEEKVTLSGKDAGVEKLAKAAKEAASPVIGTSDVILNGADSVNWNRETNLGDLVTDAFLWYAQNYVDGIDKDMPIVAMFNGGNLDQFLYTGDVTELDIFKTLPFPKGLGVIYLTGAQIIEALECGCQSEKHPGFMHVSNMTYTKDPEAEFDAGEANGKYFRAKSINIVNVTSIDGSKLDPDKKYAVVTDNYDIEGQDGAYVFADASAAGAKIIKTTVKAKDVVTLYIQKVLNGKITDKYAEPQGRITDPKEEHDTSKCVSAKFDDVNKDAEHWTHAPIDYALEKGIMAGISDTKFNPNGEVTRGMVATILYAEAGKPSVDKLKNNFTDLAAGRYYYNAVVWANSEGVVSGYPDKTFKPNAPISRQELVTILRKVAEINKKDLSADKTLDEFKDKDSINNYAKESMKWAYSHGLISGMGDQTLNPKGTATRAQVATIMMAYLETL